MGKNKWRVVWTDDAKDDLRGRVVNVARILHGAQDVEAIFQTEDDPRI